MACIPRRSPIRMYHRWSICSPRTGNACSPPSPNIAITPCDEFERLQLRQHGFSLQNVSWEVFVGCRLVERSNKLVKWNLIRADSDLNSNVKPDSSILNLFCCRHAGPKYQGRREGVLLEPRRGGVVQGCGVGGCAIFARATGGALPHPRVHVHRRKSIETSKKINRIARDVSPFLVKQFWTIKAVHLFVHCFLQHSDRTCDGVFRRSHWTHDHVKISIVPSWPHSKIV